MSIATSTAAGSAPLRLPVNTEAAAATTLATIANQNATTRPSWNGWEIMCGKKLCPVITATFEAGR
jgi:hypothetical protein